MARTGSALIATLFLLAAAPALADVEFYMTADRPKVGTEDAFHVEVVVGNAPEGASLQLPSSGDFEVLSRSESTQMSYSVGPGGAGVIKQIRRYTLVVRANRAGRLTIPPATLVLGGKTQKTEPVIVEVVKGRLGGQPPRQPSRPNLPFGFPPLPFDDDSPFDMPEETVPHSDSDLFLRSYVDKKEAFVGEQVTLTIVIYSRIDLSSVDTVSMPKLEGFWTQDIKAPTQLTPEQKVIGGVPYREYTLRQKVLFGMRPGEYVIEPAEADITTGFLFAGSRVHKKGNELKLKVKPLPAKTSNVGNWRLSLQPSQTEVTLGDPIQLKLVLEGRGNLQAVQLPPLDAPKSFRVFDPTTADKTDFRKGALVGTRTVEYVLVPQQTGTFSLPGLELAFFDPESGRVSETRTDALTLTVKPGATGQQVLGVPGNAAVAPETGPKNQLVGGGLKSLRHSATFAPPSRPLWSRPFFLPVAGAPLGLALLLALVGLVRGALGREDAASLRKKQARAARKRLRGAETLLTQGSTVDFYAEVQRALNSFLEAKLGAAVTGLTRSELDALMQQHQVAQTERAKVLAVFETCDTGRYAPGMGEAQARRRAVDDAAGAMEAWP